ncbi:gluconate 5-dehydrogenase [Alteribacillus persepolensis]|uniref:Gluconate 5-dehydrogenase n=1 Tax=Alteribacillus persepolensis TaxID=568899 RepID=A0A1G8F2K7_9BACI|nr:glucose 1-dehydrogenase [Alteribacillus persepolensis]SDH76328.1 gluconate 5-dehydrogenase [Alteribacillus persepolensis]
MRLKHKTALITGGSSGIGGAIAAAFAKEGASVMVAARTEEALRKKAQELTKWNGSINYIAGDVSNERDVKHIVQTTKKLFGSIDILVNAAGITMVSPSEELHINEWNKCMDINATGTFLMSQETGRQMIEQHTGGKIINITSIAAHAGIPQRAAYAASKGAVRQLTETLALEWGKYNIQVNAISPGYVQTPLFNELAEKGEHNVTQLENRIPLGRLAYPEDIAGPATFLASSESDYVTGVILKTDGGWLVNGHLSAH